LLNRNPTGHPPRQTARNLTARNLLLAGGPLTRPWTGGGERGGTEVDDLYPKALRFIMISEGKMKVKIFSGREAFRYKFQKALDAVEKEVNDWMAVHPQVDVIETKQTIVQSFGPREIVISIWYQDC
ncbi:MAG: hypothetical protein OSA78_09725, partial [Flavobacteriales bacterium]|nr:hypothetical protein [Flavobacteriales bacterium]